MHITSVFLGSDYCEAQEERCNKGESQGHQAICLLGAAAKGHGTSRKHRNQETCKGTAYSCKERSPGSELVSALSILSKGRDHSPIGDVMHGICNGIHEIHETEEDHEGPAVKLDIEGKINDYGCGDYSYQKPWLVFTPPCPGAFNDVSHNRVIQCIEDPCSHHDHGNGHKLCSCKLMGEQNKEQDVVGK